MTVDLQGLMVEAANTCRTSAISLGFMIALAKFFSIAQRAIILQDESILADLEVLGLVKKD